MRLTPALVLLALACTPTEKLPNDTGVPPVAHHEPEEEPLPIPAAREDAPAASPRRAAGAVSDDIAEKADAYFAGHGSRRLYTQLDRPLYRPGEDVWVRSVSLVTRGMAPDTQYGLTYELVDPRGAVVQTRQAQLGDGTAHHDFHLDEAAPGGEWTLRTTLATGEVDERPFVVSAYRAPRIRKSLDFLREGYGPGDAVEALVELSHNTAGPLVEREVTALLQVGGEVVLRETLRTDDSGAVFVRAALPDDLSVSDGLLTVLVTDGGTTESISRSVPIVLADAQLSFFPEGGDLVAGLPGRVYFEATNRHGEPADVRGEVRDDTGAVVAELVSLHDGLGRFALTPEPGRTYTAHLTQPEGLETSFPLPVARDGGCTLRSFDDVDGELDVVRVAVRCSAEREVVVTGVLHEALFDRATVLASPNQDAVVYLEPGEERASEQGAARVTVFDADRNAIAERLVYRKPGRDLQVAIEPRHEHYGPRDEVVLDVRTTAPDGRPVPASLGLAVVDDAVLSFADDEEGDILTRLYLEPELVDVPDDASWYFDADEALAHRGLDLVMGTKGWRRFEWQRVWNPPPPPPPVTVALGYVGAGVGGGGMGRGIAALEGAAFAEPMAAPMDGPMLDDAMDMGGVADLSVDEAGAEVEVAEEEELREMPLARPRPQQQMRAAARRGPMARDRRMDHDRMGGLIGNVWQTARVFPTPDYREGFTGVRTDFRDTVYWDPAVQTDADGHAEVRFYLSDAITTFRVTAEGASPSLAGRGEATVRSTLPVSLATTLPSAVSAGDQLWLPLTATSTREQSLSVDLSVAAASDLVRLTSSSGNLQLAATGSDTHWVQVDVGEGSGEVELDLRASASDLSDEAHHSLRVVAPGFPRDWSAAGESRPEEHLTAHVDAWVPGSLKAQIRWQPSTAATLIDGMDALIRTPGGCFEQTSSTNWPNVAILAYLEAHDGDPRLRARSSSALDAGYTRLAGYQVDAGGFETWGTGPGKEALSAFGLLQFTDMAKVYDVDPALLSRDAEYLLAQRNGRGGFENSGESAHGYGSAPADVLDGFITWALVATGHTDQLSREIDAQARTAETSSDPYVLALATRVLLAAEHDGAERAVRRLRELQDEDGSFPGAASSITRSYEANLLVESTALAALALMESGANRDAWDRAAGWLVDNRRGTGSWGATQATALALQALTQHAERTRRPRVGGEVSVEVNGQVVGTLRYQADEDAPLVVDGWEEHLRAGDNRIVLRQASGEPLPYTVDIAWTSVTPDSSPEAELALSTTLSEAEVPLGETVRLTARIDNQTERIVPSPIARIGLPAGLEAQTWQLQQLKDRGEIAFFETREREVTLYWDGLRADQVHEVALDLVAAVPGSFTGPASSAYPYYNDDDQAWSDGLRVSVSR